MWKLFGYSGASVYFFLASHAMSMSFLKWFFKKTPAFYSVPITKNISFVYAGNQNLIVGWKLSGNVQSSNLWLTHTAVQTSECEYSCAKPSPFEAVYVQFEEYC